MSITTSIENIIERFGRDTIISDLSLDMRSDEFFTLLSPSGRGETTLLHMIIGFNSIEGGEIKIDGKVINNIPTNGRNMEMIFQNYAIFPHMSVRDNVAFGLRNRKIPQTQIKSQIDEVLKVVRIGHPKERVPSKLFDGQQQRVALARAVVTHPEALLIDGPLSSLDAELCVEMCNAIKRIQQQMDITTLYVTYDQEEALAVSDRIAVMNGGAIQQADTSKNICQRPANLFVSAFIGLSNILDGAIETPGNTILVCMGDYAVAMDNLDSSCVNGRSIKVSIRPEEFILNRKADQGTPVIVRSSVFLGVTTHYSMETVNGREMEVIQSSDIWDIILGHTPVCLGVQLVKINVYNQDGNESLIVRREHS